MRGMYPSAPEHRAQGLGSSLPLQTREVYHRLHLLLRLFPHLLCPSVCVGGGGAAHDPPAPVDPLPPPSPPGSEALPHAAFSPSASLHCNIPMACP